MVGWPSGEVALVDAPLRADAVVALALVVLAVLSVPEVLPLDVLAPERLAVEVLPELVARPVPVLLDVPADEKLIVPVMRSWLIGGGGTVPDCRLELSVLLLDNRLEVLPVALPLKVVEVVAAFAAVPLLVAVVVEPLAVDASQLLLDPLVAAWYWMPPASMPTGRPAPAQPVSSRPTPRGRPTRGARRCFVPTLTTLTMTLPFLAANRSPLPRTRCRSGQYVPRQRRSRFRTGARAVPGYGHVAGAPGVRRYPYKGAPVRERWGCWAGRRRRRRSGSSRRRAAATLYRPCSAFARR
jgi:hypothetical protein